MAFYDYGGEVYRNGLEVYDRSEAIELVGLHHAILGDGPVYVCLYKQSGVMIYRNGEQLDYVVMVEARHPDLVRHTKYNGYPFVDIDKCDTEERIIELDVDNHKIEVAYLYTDNYYVTARLTQPDGTVWVGYSGYMVGDGFDDDSDIAEIVLDLWERRE